jgi:hypothetical protein
MQGVGFAERRFIRRRFYKVFKEKEKNIDLG